MRRSSAPISTPPAPAETALSGGEAQAREALGRSQGSVSTTLHLRAEGNGRNPGTTADVVAACLFLALLRGTIPLPSPYPWTDGWGA